MAKKNKQNLKSSGNPDHEFVQDNEQTGLLANLDRIHDEPESERFYYISPDGNTSEASAKLPAQSLEQGLDGKLHEENWSVTKSVARATKASRYYH